MRKAVVIILVVFLVGGFILGARMLIQFFLLSNEKLVISPGKPVVKMTEEFEEMKKTLDPVNYKIETYAENLFVPWSLVFTSSNRSLVTERNGTIRSIENGNVSQPLVTFDEVSTQSEEGLMGLALDPLYNLNKMMYVCYAYENSNGLAARVVQIRDLTTSIQVINTIIDDIPAAKFHAGCRLRFGPDKKLYITTGDATDKNIAQDLDSLGGKILRINSDGTIPNDNPFPNSTVWSYGHRNPQGIDWHPISGALWSTEHGPSTFDGPPGGDEVNLILKGENYGWPLVSHSRKEPNTQSPKLLFTPAEAPGSGMFYSGDIFPQFKNNFLFGALKGEGIVRVITSDGNPSDVVAYEKLSNIDVGRIREITQGPDGYIYFTTSNKDGRADPNPGDDKIYRLVPEN